MIEKVLLKNFRIFDDAIVGFGQGLNLNPPSWFGSGEGFFLGWD